MRRRRAGLAGRLLSALVTVCAGSPWGRAVIVIQRSRARVLPEPDMADHAPRRAMHTQRVTYPGTTGARALRMAWARMQLVCNCKHRGRNWSYEPDER
jgi:hypothetical protein